MEIQSKVKLRTPVRIAMILFAILTISICGFFLHQKNLNIEYPTFQVDIKANFLSDTYFSELAEQYEEIRSEHRKWFILDQSRAIASHAILTRMMDDVMENQELLYEDKQANLFFDTFDQYVKQLTQMTEQFHYFRNELNKYGEAPDRLEGMVELTACGKWKVFSARYHRYQVDEYDSAHNMKFISTDGRFEAVYNTETGQIVTDPINMGTYNFAPGSMIPWQYYQHHKYDKVPWKKWGNTDQIAYDEIKQRESRHGSLEQKKSADVLEELIESKISESPSC